MSQLTPQEQITKNTYDRQAKNWSSSHMSSGFWAEEMQNFHNFLPKGKILEIGSGGGRDARELIELGYEYIGTDVSTGLLEQAKKNNPTATFLEKSVYDLEYNNEFDGFWCSAVLLHIPRDRINEAMKSIWLAIKSGGIGFISVKEGIGQKMESDDEYTGDDKRLFTYWQNEDFKQALGENHYDILADGYKPLSERTKWLTYIVKVSK